MSKAEKFARRARRVRYQVQKRIAGKSRIVVSRSSRNIYAQMIDAKNSHVLYRYSSLMMTTQISTYLQLLANIGDNVRSEIEKMKIFDRQVIKKITPDAKDNLTIPKKIQFVLEIYNQFTNIIGCNESIENIEQNKKQEEIIQIFELNDFFTKYNKETIANIKTNDALSKFCIVFANVMHSICIASKSKRAVVVGWNFGKQANAMTDKRVVFDKGGYSYHGVVAKLADAIRATGLQF